MEARATNVYALYDPGGWLAWDNYAFYVEAKGTTSTKTSYVLKWKDWGDTQPFQIRKKESTGPISEKVWGDAIKGSFGHVFSGSNWAKVEITREEP